MLTIGKKSFIVNTTENIPIIILHHYKKYSILENVPQQQNLL